MSIEERILSWLGIAIGAGMLVFVITFIVFMIGLMWKAMMTGYGI